MLTTRRSLLLTLPLAVPGVRSTCAAQASPTPDRYAHPDWLVDAAQLEAMLAEPEIKVVALSKTDAFEAGHIPGAAQVDWPELEIVETGDQQVATWRGSVEATLTRLGLTPADTVVIYDAGALHASRFWWVLHQLGHERKVILNGGLDTWTAAGGDLETGPSTAAPAAERYAGTPNEDAIATIDEVIAAYEQPDVVLVDARPPDQYVAGHIPGAVNIEFTRNNEPDPPKVWKSTSDLLAMYADAGVTADKRVIPYCTSGVRSANAYFTLRLIGYENVALFTGSFQEWSSHPELPVTTGDEP